jgi:hypothetical protein
MKKIILALLIISIFLLGGISLSKAAVIDFTGGTVYLLNGTTQTTNNSDNWEGVDYYEENGFKLDFIPNTGSEGFATQVGDYYGANDDVIHAHWSAGVYGGITAIEITKIGGGTFDLNYFILTSNTEFGGAEASGREQAYIEGFSSSASTGSGVLLPPEDWGFPATQIFLGSAFDSVDLARFYVTNTVDCFGMDEFFINEDAPPPVPIPGAVWLLGTGLIGLVGFRKKFKNK